MNVEIKGPQVLLYFPDLGIKVTETVITSVIILAVVFILCKILTHKMERIPRKRTQQLAEKLVIMIDNLVVGSMGERNKKYAPYILTIMVFSAFGSLISLFGFRSVTSDLNVTVSWALITFVLIWRAGFKANGVRHLKGLLEPMPFMLPLNLISEVATPVSMALRHFGNIFAGSVISTLLYAALSAATYAIVNIGFPFLAVGIPAVLSLYFDLFSGFIQAFIFSMLTMAYISNANDVE